MTAGAASRTLIVGLGLCSLAFLSGCNGGPPIGDQQNGRFVGKVQTEWADDGRTMTLLADFTYIDPHGVKWSSPKGCVIDGASIPQLFWSFPGGPFSGIYRKASVVHDIACNEPRQGLEEKCWGRKRPYRAVHRMFFDAMLTSGVNPQLAKLMYWAVRIGGPTWDDSGADVASVLSEEERSILAATAANLYDVLDASPAARMERLAVVDSEYRGRLIARGMEEVPAAGRFELFTEDARRNLAIYSTLSTPADRVTKTYAVARAIAGENPPSIDEIDETLNRLLSRDTLVER